MSLLDDLEPQTVAVVRLRTGLGDLLCGVPALRALRARLPRAHVVLVTFGEMAPVVARQRPWVDELLAFPGWDGIPERPPDRAALPAFLAAARERRFDLALQAYGMRPAAHEVTHALGARRTAGFFVPGLVAPPDLEDWIPYPQHLHEVDRHLALMEHLGAPRVDDGALEFPLTAADEAEAAALGLAPGFVVLHPGATSPSRRWPVARFAAVGDALAADGLEVVVTGTADEGALTAAVCGAMRAPARDLAGAVGLGGFGAVVRDAALLVGSDTGATHVAAAVGTPSVTAFLSGDPVRFGHAGRGPHAVARVPVGCNPCEHLRCPIDHRCATRLPPSLVLTRARELLSVHSNCTKGV